MGPFAQDLFASQGASTDYTRQLTQDFFLAVNLHWLEEFHIDGFRYDCVPNYWDGPTGVGYAKLVYQTHDLVAKQVANGALPRFGTADPLGSSSAPSNSRIRSGSCGTPTATPPGKTVRPGPPVQSRTAKTARSTA
jgi:hypothetical protein